MSDEVIVVVDVHGDLGAVVEEVELTASTIDEVALVIELEQS